MKKYNIMSGTMNMLSISPEDIDEMLGKGSLSSQTSDRWAWTQKSPLQTVY